MKGIFQVHEVNSFKVIREILCIPENTVQKELIAYLQAGWTLLNIAQREYRDPQTNEVAKTTVYTVGHIDAQAVHPKWNDITGSD
jgi:hypothetical protein